MVVEITDEMRAMAHWAEAQVGGKYKKRGGKSYTGLEAEGRWYYGFLGELVFLKYCQLMSIRHRYEPEYLAQADKTDFIVWPIGYTDNGGRCGIDVKTASKPSHNWLMTPTAQLQHHPSQVYVGVRLREMQTKGEVIGYCLKKDLVPVTELGLKVPTMGCRFDDLRPIEDMINKCVKIMG